MDRPFLPHEWAVGRGGSGWVVGGWVGVGGGWMGWVALIKFPGGSQLLLLVAAGDYFFYVFSNIFRPLSGPSFLQFWSDFEAPLGRHVGTFGTTFVYIFDHAFNIDVVENLSWYLDSFLMVFHDFQKRCGSLRKHWFWWPLQYFCLFLAIRCSCFSYIYRSFSKVEIYDVFNEFWGDIFGQFLKLLGIITSTSSVSFFQVFLMLHFLEFWQNWAEIGTQFYWLRPPIFDFFSHLDSYMDSNEFQKHFGAILGRFRLWKRRFKDVPGDDLAHYVGTCFQYICFIVFRNCSNIFSTFQMQLTIYSYVRTFAFCFIVYGFVVFCICRW